MKKKPEISEEERALFRATVGQVTPIKLRKVDSAVLQRQRQQPKVKVKSDVFLEETMVSEPVSPVRAEEILSFRRTGIQNKLFKKLRLGAIPIEAELDLHGMRADEAEIAINRFLARCLQRNLYCVCIVHGKGGGRGETYPILKNKLNLWLRNYAPVLAFHSAPLRMGGAGAVFVLLKRGN